MRRLTKIVVPALALVLGVGIAIAVAATPSGDEGTTSTAADTTTTTSGTADAVRAVIDATAPGDRGCEFGQAVAAAATGQDPNGDKDPCAHQGGQGARDEQGDQGGSEETGNGAGPDNFGQQVSADARANASTDRRAFGERTSAAAQQLGDEHAQGGPETGQSHSGGAGQPAGAGGGPGS